MTFGWANMPLRMIDNGLRLFAMGVFVSVTVGMNRDNAILATGLITLAYTFAGGLWATTVTDFVQCLVMLAGIVVLLPAALLKVGGLGGLIAGSPPEFFHFTAGSYTWVYLLAWFLIVLCNYNTSPGLIQRYYSVRDERAARKTGLLVAGMILVATPLFFLPAMAARQFMPDVNPKDVYPMLCVTLLPAGALGLIIAAMFSATMSSLSGDYNALAAVLTNDVYKRLVRPDASERRLVVIGRLATFVIGVVPVGIALFVSHSAPGQELFRKMVTVFSIAGPPIAIPMLAGLIWKRASYMGATIGFLLGLVTGLILYALLMTKVIPVTGEKSTEIILTFSTFGVTLAGLIVASLLFPAKVAEQRRRDGFVEKMRTAVPPIAELASANVPSPWKPVGGAVSAAALLLLIVIPTMEWNASAATNLAVSLGLLIVGIAMLVRGLKTAPPAKPDPVPDRHRPDQVETQEIS